MNKLAKFLVFLIAGYIVFSIFGFEMLMKDSESTSGRFMAVQSEEQPAANTSVDEYEQLQNQLKELEHRVENLNAEKEYISAKLSKKPISPFHVLGAYPDISYIFERPPTYNKPHLGLINEDDYCDRVDLYNLQNPDNMFKEMNFITDCPKGHLARARVMEKIGKVVMNQLQAPMKDFDERKYKFDITINNYFHNFKGVMEQYHEIGKNFLCATQMYNHIPGHYNLIRKDSILNSLNEYAIKYQDRPQCFHKHQFFPTFFRLYDKNECTAFFDMLNSQQYAESLKAEPIQYLVKIGRGSHKGQGVFLLDDKEALTLNTKYNYGAKCGRLTQSLIAQSYVTNPLLLDMNNKFDFRIYVLIASTNPLIAYLHDGFLRVALNPFSKVSEDKATHLTNTFLANQKIEDAKNAGKQLNGMTEDELKEYHLWSFDRLQTYLLETGKTTDKNWLDNYLRPAFKKALIHILKMTSEGFLKNSNVYELHGVDFILDDKMNLWFIESNPSPLLTGTTKHMIYYSVIKDMFDVMYAYYRGRMSRMVKLIEKMAQEEKQGGTVNYEKYRAEYQQAAQNKLEPEFPIREDNAFSLIMDEGKPGVEAYGGLISEDCLLN